MIGRSSEANLFIKVNVILYPINSCIYMYICIYIYMIAANRRRPNLGEFIKPTIPEDF